ncbi:hypothetical protein IJI70_00545 [Candidatus Saccharibacteria bacterium]|nr:hypothetical protein [Candidatus Saccharibacteria bacterium]
MPKKVTEAPSPVFNPEELETKLKDELRHYLDEKLDDRFLDKIEDVNKKLLREKNHKIWFRNIFILILLVLIGFETCALYNSGFFDNFLSHKSEETSVSASAEKPKSNLEVSVEEKTPSLSELKEKYSPLLKNFNLPADSAYYSDFMSGNLTNELKLYFSLNSLDFTSLETEEDYNLVAGSALLSAAKKLFSSSDLKLASFDFNGNKLRYLEKLDSFVSSEILKKSETSTELSADVTEIKELSNSEVEIKTKAGLSLKFKDNRLASLSKSE